MEIALSWQKRKIQPKLRKIGGREGGSFLLLPLEPAEGVSWQGDACVSSAGPIPPYASAFAWAQRMLSFPSVSVEFPHHTLDRGWWVWGSWSQSWYPVPTHDKCVTPQGSLNLWVTTRRAPQWEYWVRGLRRPLAGRWFCWCGREGNVSPALILPVWGPGPFQGQTVATAMEQWYRVGKAMRGGMAVGMENPFQEAAGGWLWAETPSPLRVPLDFTYKIEIQRENF